MRIILKTLAGATVEVDLDVRDIDISKAYKVDVPPNLHSKKTRTFWFNGEIENGARVYEEGYGA